MTGIFMPGDLILVASFCTSATIYLAILTKFCYNYSKLLLGPRLIEVDNRKFIETKIQRR